MRTPLLIGAALCIAGAVLIAFTLWQDRARAEHSGRFATLQQGKPSPSDAFIAKVETGAEQNGVATWITVIQDKSGREVFRDSYAYSTRHGVGITWLSTADQLWLISSDVGLARIDKQDDGRWTKTTITPEMLAQVPQEIAQLRR
jgi:hypothetical protein